MKLTHTTHGGIYMKTILLYTREPLDSAIYDPKLAYSMHIALKTESGYTALNHNSGVFFAKATENADGTLNSKTLRSPIAFKLADGGYGIMAVRTNEIGNTDNERLYLLHRNRSFKAERFRNPSRQLQILRERQGLQGMLHNRRRLQNLQTDRLRLSFGCAC